MPPLPCCGGVDPSGCINCPKGAGWVTPEGTLYDTVNGVREVPEPGPNPLTYWPDPWMEKPPVTKFYNTPRDDRGFDVCCDQQSYAMLQQQAIMNGQNAKTIVAQQHSYRCPCGLEASRPFPSCLGCQRILQQIEAEPADVPCARDYSKPLPDVTRDVHETLAAREARDPAVTAALQEAERLGLPPECLKGDNLESLLQSIDDYYDAIDPHMTGKGVGDNEPWLSTSFVHPMSQEEWDAYYTRFDHGYQPTPDEIEVQTAANLWRAEHEHDDTEHLMASPANAERLLESILQARGERYGAFADNALVAQQIKHALKLGPNVLCLADDQMEALHQIASKISRIVTGDPDYVDNWDDIAGYAKLVADRLREDA